MGGNNNIIPDEYLKYLKNNDNYEEEMDDFLYENNEHEQIYEKDKKLDEFHEESLIRQFDAECNYYEEDDYYDYDNDSFLERIFDDDDDDDDDFF